MVYVVSERPAVGRSGPIVDPEGLSRCPSLIPDWPCTGKVSTNGLRVFFVSIFVGSRRNGVGQVGCAPDALGLAKLAGALACTRTSFSLTTNHQQQPNTTPTQSHPTKRRRNEVDI